MSICFCFWNILAWRGWTNHVYIVRCLRGTSICKWMHWADASKHYFHIQIIHLVKWCIDSFDRASVRACPAFQASKAALLNACSKGLSASRFRATTS